MHANFLLGTLIYEESVEAAIGRNPLDLIARHAVCDHGIVSRRQKVRNRIALDEHDEIYYNAIGLDVNRQKIA